MNVYTTKKNAVKDIEMGEMYINKLLISNEQNFVLMKEH